MIAEADENVAMNENVATRAIFLVKLVLMSDFSANSAPFPGDDGDQIMIAWTYPERKNRQSSK